MPRRASGRLEAIRLLKKDSSAAKHSPQQMKFAVNYLTFFGYLGIELLKNLDIQDLKKAVKLFQKIFGLKQSGELDSSTMRAMEKVRCGCPDVLDAKNKAHIQYMRTAEVVEGKKDQWNKTGLTYSIQNYVTGKLSKETQKQIFHHAFRAWDQLCGLEIRYVPKVKQADIVISTGTGRTDNFDGRGGTLAWAYTPTGTDNQLLVKFDLDETWVNESKDRGILLTNVACHEIGHALGLLHSNKPAALMAPYYNPFIGMPQANDDITNIQKLYGKQPLAVKTFEDCLTLEIKPGQKVLVVCD